MGLLQLCQTAGPAHVMDLLDWLVPPAALCIHLCIGNLIARAEIRAVVAEMLSRTSSFSLRGGEDGVSWLTNFIVYGPDGIQLDVEPV